jgi:hypothetical protein
MYSTTRIPLHKRSREFGMFCHQLDGTIDLIKEFLNDSLNVVNDKFNRIEAEYVRIRKKNQEEGKIFYQHDYESRRVATYELKEIICFTSISFLYTQFETKFIALANLTYEIFGGNSFDNYTHKCRKNNKGINKAKNFIIDTSKIDISDIEGFWSKIKQFQNLRNCIIHRNGIVKREPSIIQFAQSNANLNYHEPSDMIQIEKEFIEEFTVILFDYMELIVIKLYNKLNEQ